jgi:LacI family transcriptional regulator
VAVSGTAGGGRRPGAAEAPQQVTLRDVAERAGVHMSTVSRALNPEQSNRIADATVARVRTAAAELGYTPDLVAAGLKRGRTKSVGVVVADLDNPYNGLLIRGLSAVLEEHGFVALVAESVEDPARLERILRHLAGRRVDAIVTTAAQLSNAELLERVASPSMPVVLGVRNIPGSGLPAVLHDDHHGAALAAEHLYEHGHRTVAQLLGPLGIDTFVRRRDGFRSVISKHPDMLDVTIDASASKPTLGEGRRLMELTLGQHQGMRPTAVFAHNDLMAVGALEAIKEAGLECPRDISVIGYNDVPLGSALSPPLTTIRLPSLEVGKQIGETVLTLIADPGADVGVVRLPAELVLRASTAPLARKPARGKANQPGKAKQPSKANGAKANGAKANGRKAAAKPKPAAAKSRS